MNNNIDESLVRDYLLGSPADDVELQADKFSGIEERYLADPEFFEQMLAIEENLIQEYANSALPPEETRRFEQTYLKDPKKRKRVQFARVLRKWVDRRE